MKIVDILECIKTDFIDIFNTSIFDTCVHKNNAFNNIFTNVKICDSNLKL